MTPKPLTHPSLLKKKIREIPVKVFLCGPGYDHSSFSIREAIRTKLQEIVGVSVHYGESLTSAMVRSPKTDMQAIEIEFANQTDLTILILNSPGSMAELGTFSMIPNIRSRLFVFVPGTYYGATSYIARGPLSILARSEIQNIVYFGQEKDSFDVSALYFPISLAKIANYRNQFIYSSNVYTPSWPAVSMNFEYERFITPIRNEYIDTLVYMSILVADSPTFVDLVNVSQTLPKTLHSSLGRLFKYDQIEKIDHNRYRTKRQYADRILRDIDSGLLSKLRSARLALT